MLIITIVEWNKFFLTILMHAANLQHIPVTSNDTDSPYFFTTSPLMFTAMLQAYALASSGTVLLMTSEKLFKIL